MVYMSSLLVFLKFFGLFANENIKKHSLLDTLRTITLSIPVMIVLVPTTLAMYKNRAANDLASLTNCIYILSIYGMFFIIFVYLSWTKFVLRDILCELRTVVEKRNEHLN